MTMKRAKRKPRCVWVSGLTYLLRYSHRFGSRRLRLVATHYDTDYALVRR